MRKGVALEPSALLVGIAIGSVFAAPMTLLVLPLASYAIDGRPCDRPLGHAGIGLVAGTAWMLWVGFDDDGGVTTATLEFCLAGAVAGAACGYVQAWVLRHQRQRATDRPAIGR